MTAADAPTEVTPDSLFQIAGGFMAAKHLFIANEVGLFEQLAGGPASLDDLAQRTGIARRRLRIVADALVSMGLLECLGGRYRNGPVAATFLSGATPADLRPALRFWDRLSYPTWARFEAAVRTGQGQSTLHLAEEEQRIFSEGVEAGTAGPAQALPDAYDFSCHRRLLDVGGGTGSWLGPSLRRYPHLEASLFELPAAAVLARRHLAADPATRQVAVVAGDFFANPLPGGHDAILVANVAHLFSPEHNRDLLRRARRANPAWGRLLLVDFWTDPTHTQPPLAALLAGEFLAITGEGDVYSVEEVAGWLGETGWQLVDHRPVIGPTSAIVAEAVV